MIDNPDYLADFYAWLILVVFFSAFTKNVQETTLQIGKNLFGAKRNSTGVQDAITPTWQTRNNVITIVLLVVYFGMAMFVFKWYIGVAIFLFTFFVAIPLTSKFLIFRPSSAFIVKKIKNNLLKRKESYKAAGDSLRAEAVTEVLSKMEEITNINNRR